MSLLQEKIEGKNTEEIHGLMRAAETQKSKAIDEILYGEFGWGPEYHPMDRAIRMTTLIHTFQGVLIARGETKI